MASSASDTPSEQLAAALFAQAEGHAERRGFRFGDGADHDMRHMALIAAEAVMARPDREAATSEAERAFGRLIEAMIAARGEVYGLDALRDNVIGEGTLHRARMQICPLWPIC
jgi:hypothetical protein